MNDRSLRYPTDPQQPRAALERLAEAAAADGQADLARACEQALAGDPRALAGLALALSDDDDADRLRAEWRRARAQGDRVAARGARLLWSIFERAAREAERAAAGAAFERARRSLADRLRADLAGGAA